MEVVTNNVESRPLAHYHPHLWGNRFLDLPVSDINEATKNREEFEKLKLEIKGEVVEETSYMRLLQMIDAIQRLGLGYHFEEEIDLSLTKIYDEFSNHCSADVNHYGLYATALGFRLLRQHGYNVPSDVFVKFKIPKADDRINSKDVVGMLEYFEATQLRVHGEDILDKGFSSTRDYLESLLPILSTEHSSPSTLYTQVHHALKLYTIRRGLSRVETLHYISMYDKLHESSSHHLRLLKLAKIDFSMVKSLHRRELSEICRWYNDLEIETKVPYARHRVVETYFWVTGIYFEPEYSLARKLMTKAQFLLSLYDDSYDAYGTYEELMAFTDAMESWSYSCLDQLPENMKVLCRATLDLFSEVEEELSKQGRSYSVSYGIEAMKFMCRSYMAEAKWRHEKHIPKTEEYMETATVTAGFMSLIAISLLGMGDVATKEAFDWVLSNPKMVKATSIICRLTNDIVGHEFESKRDHVLSAVECYMEEHDVTEKRVVEIFKERIEDAWKDINEGFMRPTKFPAPILERVLNHARIIDVIYRQGDWYTHVGPEMRGFIEKVFVDTVEY